MRLVAALDRLAAAGAAEADRGVVAHQSSAPTGEDRRQAAQACHALEADASGESSDAAPPGDGANDRRPAAGEG